MSTDEPRTPKESSKKAENPSKHANTQMEIPSAWFTGTFRSNFKNVFAHLLNEEPPQETKSLCKEPQLQYNKNQFCVQWCSHVGSHTDSTTVPSCRMWCMRRVEEEANWNPFSGIHFYCVDGLENCQEQLEGLNEYTPATNGLESCCVTRASYHIDFGEKSEKFKDEAVRIVKKTFSPGYEWGRRYLMSWQDGTQSRFFERFSTSVKQGDGLDLAKKSFMKIMESLRGEK